MPQRSSLLSGFGGWLASFIFIPLAMIANCLVWILATSLPAEWTAGVCLITSGVIYCISPVNWIPNWVPILGKLDDLVFGWGSMAVGTFFCYEADQQVKMPRDAMHLGPLAVCALVLFLSTVSKSFKQRALGKVTSVLTPFIAIAFLHPMVAVGVTLLMWGFIYMQTGDANVQVGRDLQGELATAPADEQSAPAAEVADREVCHEKMQIDAAILYFDVSAQRWRDPLSGQFAKAPTSGKIGDASAQRTRDLQGEFTTRLEDEPSSPEKAKWPTRDLTPEKTKEEKALKPCILFTKNDKIDKRCKAFRDQYVLLKEDGDVDQRCKAFKDGYVKVEENGSIDKSCQAYQDALKRRTPETAELPMRVSTPEKTKEEKAEEKPCILFTKIGKVDKRCKAFRDQYVLLKDDGDVDQRCKAFKDGYVKVEENGSIDKSCQAYQDALKRSSWK